jgi:tRNA pseudouridine38-40 synthase
MGVTVGGIIHRYALVVSYDGTEFAGWQIQPNAVTIQQLLETGLSRLFDAPIRIHGAGRTDAGVHARGQVCHFDATAKRDPERIVHAMNGMLPGSIRIRNAWETPLRFHARVSAVGKHYRYLIHIGRVVSPFQNRWVWQVPTIHRLDAMSRAAKMLEGTHDFLSFSVNPKREVEDSIRTIYGMILDFVGNGFLYKMVRSLTGTLVRIGQGRQEPESVLDILAARDRCAAAQTAPAHGLFMWRVLYPPRRPEEYARKLLH